MSVIAGVLSHQGEKHIVGNVRLQETRTELWKMMPSLLPFSESQEADCHVSIPSYPLHRILSTQLAGTPMAGSSVDFYTSLITKVPELREQPYKLSNLTTGFWRFPRVGGDGPSVSKMPS